MLYFFDVLLQLPEVIGEIDAHSVDSEMVKKMKDDQNRWDICLLAKQDCHNVLFGAYCKAKVMRYLHLYPTAMTCKSAKTFFIQKY